MNGKKSAKAIVIKFDYVMWKNVLFLPLMFKTYIV